MKLTPQSYKPMVEAASPPSNLKRDCLWAFGVGGGICLLGEVLRQTWLRMGFTLTDAGTLTSVSLIALSGVFTGLGLYQKLAAKAGAGTLVPITGFANSIAAPALEFKTEGFVLGTCVKMFSIAGPVLTWGISASVAYGILLWLTEVMA